MSETTASGAVASIDPGTAMGIVRLTVSDLVQTRRFYEQVLGLHAREGDDGDLVFSAVGGRPLVEVRGDPSATPLDRRATGLFHLAILLPSRADLAQALLRIAQTRWPLDGASDHLVSEALYLSDPDGNGIEIYRDRPRDEWRYEGGQLQMATLALDLEDLIGEIGGRRSADPQAPTATTMGHVHLQVSDVASSEAFYHGVLGFDVMVRGYPGALFVSAGGYHHHLGLNTWNSRGGAPAAPGSIGLRSLEVVVPDQPALDSVLGRLRGAGIDTVADPSGAMTVRDPNGISVRLLTA
jgi:catechol 2,3-dioxygenase